MNQVDYQEVAEFIYALGWRPNCDAQHENLRDALPKLRALLTPPVGDGGPAFPIQEPQAIHAKAAAAIIGVEGTDERDKAYMLARAAAVGGMTLRTYIATKAMQGILAGAHPICQDDDCCASVADAAYAMADAMLREGAK